MVTTWKGGSLWITDVENIGGGMCDIIRVLTETVKSARLARVLNITYNHTSAPLCALDCFRKHETGESNRGAVVI